MKRNKANLPYVGLRDAATMLGVSYGLLYKRQSDFSAYRIGKKIMIPKQVLSDFLHSKGIKTQI